MARPRAGAILRGNRATARALTEYRLVQLRRMDAGAELRRFVEFSRKGTMTVDVGASVGNFALASAHAVGRAGRVIAIEPNPEVFKELVNSTWGAPVTPLNLAASNERSVAHLNVPSDGAGGSVPPMGSLEQQAGEHSTFAVRTVLLDDLVPPTADVSAIKIDVEGHEASVLEGATETIDRCHPVVVMEVEARHLTHGSVEETADLLLKRGYEGWGIRGNDLLPWADFDVQEWQTRYLVQQENGLTGILPGYVNNFLFRPTER